MALVRINRRAIEEMQRSGEWGAHLTKVGNAIARDTRRNAKMREYRESVEVQLRFDAGEVICRVGTGDPLAHLDEWGSINNPPTGAMRRAVEGLGLEADFS